MEAPRLPWLFKISNRRNPNRFEYKPRFYDPKKEELEHRKEKIRRALFVDEKLAKEAGNDFRNRINAGWLRNYRKKTRKQSSIRLLIILALFIFIGIYLLIKLEVFIQ